MLNCGERIERSERELPRIKERGETRGSAAYRLGEVVEVDGGEAEEVLAAEPPDRRHASSVPPYLPFSRSGAVAAPERGPRRRTERVEVGAALYPEFRIRVSPPSLSLVELGPRLVEASRG